MSDEVIRQALEAHLASMPGALAAAYENKTFKPSVGVPYWRVNILPAEPEDAVHGSALVFERGIFQVTLCYPDEAGTGGIEAMANDLKARFKRGTSLVRSGLTIIVMRHPSKSTGYIDGDRYCVAVSVVFQVQVQT